MSIEFLANISGVEHQSQKMSLCSAKEVTKLEQRIKQLEAQTKEAWEHYDAILEDCGDSKDKRIKELEARLNLKVSLPVLTSRMISDWAGRWPLIEKNSDRWWDWTQEAVDFACLLSTPEEED